MAVRRFIPLKGNNTFQSLVLEKRLIDNYFPFINTKIVGDSLLCYGYCQPSEYSIIYEYRIEYKAGEYPNVYPTYPKIEYHDDIHLYNDLSLCLYYPKDFSFTKESHLYNTIIPWIQEWYVFYEIYQITGKWQHPFVEHNKIKNGF